nr:leukocyte elastase inhibitor-like [Cherax quadricarinatus]
MGWIAVSVVALMTAVVTTVGSTVPHCFADNNRNPSRSFNTDLSGISDFGFDLYRQLSSKGTAKNFFFSPYSIWTALTLTYFGSAGNTKTQLEASLRVTGKTSTLRLWRALEVMYAQRAASNPQYTFNMANRVYFDNILHLRPCITNILHKELHIVDFSDVSLYLKTNCHTTLEILRWSSINFPFLHISVHSTQLQAKILELPYSGDAISMLLLLPDVEGETGFFNMVSVLSGESLSRVTSGLGSQTVPVELLLPKFKLEETLNNELKESLMNLGIRDLFNGTLANLTEFVVRNHLSVSKTIHKAFVEVSEEGTEAAAATAVIAYTRSSFSKAHPLVQKFHCVRPFVFLIHDNHTKNVLFMGAYKNPPRDSRKGGGGRRN